VNIPGLLKSQGGGHAVSIRLSSILMNITSLWPLLKQAAGGWREDRAASMGAALAYYTAFSVAPLLIIAIAVAGLFFGRDATQEAIVAQIGSLVGVQVATRSRRFCEATAISAQGSYPLSSGSPPWSWARPLPSWNCKTI
jgi:uncharacterized BrkB/YihY/UPF0761 family membrane protein